MSAVRALTDVMQQPQELDSTRQEANPIAEIQAMQDVLYDILATGIDPDLSDAPSAEIERFLHEHARTPKTIDEFRAFFAVHGLSVRTRPLPQPSEAFSLPPIECPPSASAILELPASALEDERDTAAHRVRPSAPPPPPLPRRSTRRLGLAAAGFAFACIATGLGFTAYRGYAELSALRAEVGRSSQNNRQNERAIAALREHAKDIESSVNATGELVQRVDQKSDIVLQFVQAEEAKHTKKHH